MADIVNLKNPVTGNRVYPITKTNLVINDEGKNADELYAPKNDEVYNFAKEEYEKTLNLWNGNYTNGIALSSNGGTYNDTNKYTSDFIEIESNKRLFTNGISWGNFYDLNKNFISQVSGTGNTSPSNAKYFRFTADISNGYEKMISYVDVSYIKYYGEIVHKNDLKEKLNYINTNSSYTIQSSNFINNTWTNNVGSGWLYINFYSGSDNTIYGGLILNGHQVDTISRVKHSDIGFLIPIKIGDTVRMNVAGSGAESRESWLYYD